jgi:hypothetical protein
VAYRAYSPTPARTVIVNNYHGRSPWVTHKVYKVKGPKKVVVVKDRRGPGPGKGHGKGHGKH